MLDAHDVLGNEMKQTFTSPAGLVSHGLFAPPTLLALSGVVVAWFLYLKKPELPGKIANTFKLAYKMLESKYGFDRFNEIFSPGARAVSARRSGGSVTFF